MPAAAIASPFTCAPGIAALFTYTIFMFQILAEG